ncbi:MAG: hypothetical protein ACRDF1_11585 [bacterium]
MPENERVTLRKVGFIHNDCIVLVDEIGDAYNEPPHLLVVSLTPYVLFDDFRWVVEINGFGRQIVLQKGAADVTHIPPA